MYQRRLIQSGALLLILISNSSLAANSQAYILTQQQQKQAANNKPDDQKIRADYQRLEKSVTALSQALKRDAGPEQQALLLQIHEQQQLAQQQASKKQYHQALATLQSAYQTLTHTIVSIKDGQSSPLNPVETATSDNKIVTLEHEWATNLALLNTLQQQTPNSPANPALQHIESLHQQAQAASDAGDQSQAHQLLLQARTAIRDQVVLLNPSVSTPPPSSTQTTEATPAYQQKRASMLALIDAARRISHERHLSDGFVNKAEAALASADAQFANAQAEQAQQKLDIAWLELKGQMRNMLSQNKSNKMHKTR